MARIANNFVKKYMLQMIIQGMKTPKNKKTSFKKLSQKIKLLILAMGNLL